MPKSAKPTDKSVFDIKIAATRTKGWVTLAVSADSTLSDLHVGILGALEFKGTFREIENTYRFTIDGEVYENGRGSRTALRKLLSPNMVLAYACEPTGLELTCTIEAFYQVATRRNYPKAIADSDGSVGHGLMLATTLAQYAMRREYRYDEPPIPKRSTAYEALSPAYEHGFLTAVCAGPLVMPTEWLGRFMAGLTDMDVVRRNLDRVMTFYNGILREMEEAPETFRERVASLCLTNSEGESLCEWTRGFFDAMAIRGDEWLAHVKDPEFKRAFEPLAAALEITRSDEKRLWLKDAPFRQDLAGALGASALWVSETFRTQPMRASVSPLRRQAPKISPNAPCACGSGKKHKRCCGA